jgi:hypothetical protein
LQDAKSAPVTLALATPQISSTWWPEANQASEQLVERLKKDAKIEYSEQAKSFKDLGAAPASTGEGVKDDESGKYEAISRGVTGFK